MYSRSLAVETQHSSCSLQPSITQAIQRVHSEAPELTQVGFRKGMMLDVDARVAWLGQGVWEFDLDAGP